MKDTNFDMSCIYGTIVINEKWDVRMSATGTSIFNLETGDLVFQKNGGEDNDKFLYEIARAYVFSDDTIHEVLEKWIKKNLMLEYNPIYTFRQINTEYNCHRVIYQETIDAGEIIFGTIARRLGGKTYAFKPASTFFAFDKGTMEVILNKIKELEESEK